MNMAEKRQEDYPTVYMYLLYMYMQQIYSSLFVFLFCDRSIVHVG